VSDQTQATLLALFQHHVALLNAADFAAAFAIFSEDSEFVDATATVVVGRSAIEVHFGRIPFGRKPGAVLVPIATEARELGGPFATLRWDYELRNVADDGEQSLRRKGTLTWVLDNSSGEWLVRVSQNTFAPLGVVAG